MTMQATWAAGEDQACLGAFAVATVMTLCAVPFARRLAVRLGAVAMPGGRHVHLRPTARLGGLAILAGVLAAAPLGLALLPAEWREGVNCVPILLGALVVCLLGARDDVRAMAPGKKLLGLAAAAAVLIAGGVSMQVVELPLLGKVALGPLGALVTVLWVLLCSNAVNLIDGVDGLGAGVVLTAAGSLALIALGLGDPGSAVLLCATAGACAGFLVHNREPARIFLGDSGSLLLGYLLAAVSLSGSTKRATALFLVAALCALAVPLLDSTHAFVRRFREALTRPGQRRLWRALQATTVGDRGHLHHRLLFRGHTHRQVARAVSLTTLLTSLVAMLLLSPDQVGWLTIAGAVLAAAYVLYRLAAPARIALAEKDVVLPAQPPARRAKKQRRQRQRQAAGKEQP